MALLSAKMKGGRSQGEAFFCDDHVAISHRFISGRGRPGERMLSVDDVRLVAPALQKYSQALILGDVWKRPGLAPRDRSIVTLAALIAHNQAIEMPYYFNLALDNGVKPREISEIITHLAFYSGWANAMSAVAVAKDVFAQRGIGADQLPPASPALLPLDEAAEAERAARIEQQFGGGSGNRRVHNRCAVPRSVAASGPCAPGSQSSDCRRPDCYRSSGSDSLPPQQGHG
jgi:alkylhydroperoxidase/carboxymuconolactone decarboxylase family protein YurZ